jgi:hypothetical protein
MVRGYPVPGIDRGIPAEKRAFPQAEQALCPTINGAAVIGPAPAALTAGVHDAPPPIKIDMIYLYG